MLNVQLEKSTGIAILEPHGELSKEDFEAAAVVIDPYLKQHRFLNGIIIHVRFFPGWESFSSLVAHLKFVKEHHRKVSRVAFVTDSSIGDFAQKIATHFVSAETKKFEFNELGAAKEWIAQKSD